MPAIYILSDSIGETGEMVIRAAASQFEGEDFDIRRIPYVNSTADIEQVFREASREKAAVFYTIVSPELKQFIEQEASKLNLMAVDLISPVIKALHEKTGIRPKYEPGLIRKLDESYFNRIKAIEFAVKFDDGKAPWGLQKADFIIIGVSRTSKTPLCMYLARQGIKAVNIPLVPEISLPKEIFTIAPQKVVGLTISPTALYAIRKQRAKSMGVATQAFDYVNMARIVAELEYAEHIMHKIGCVIIDVTDRAVEETARIILDEGREE